MIATDRLAAFATAAFVLIVVPGPSVLFVISRGVALGRRAALATVLGNAGGLLAQVVAVALGVGTVVARSAAVFQVLKLGGAAYIVVLGVRALRDRKRLSTVLDAGVAPASARRLLAEGFVVGVSNPKSIVFFAAVLPQFVDRSLGHVPLQLAILGLVFVAIALVCDSLWAVAAGTARQWLAGSPARLEALGGIGGVLMIGLGLRLALTGRKD